MSPLQVRKFIITGCLILLSFLVVRTGYLYSVDKNHESLNLLIFLTLMMAGATLINILVYIALKRRQ
jgi:hypothetical protein